MFIILHLCDARSHVFHYQNVKIITPLIISRIFSLF